MRSVDGVTLPFIMVLICCNACSFSATVLETMQSAGAQNLQFAHVGIVGGEQHADIAGDARQNHPASAEAFQQCIQCRVVEPECFGLSTK